MLDVFIWHVYERLANMIPDLWEMCALLEDSCRACRISQGRCCKIPVLGESHPWYAMITLSRICKVWERRTHESPYEGIYDSKASIYGDPRGTWLIRVLPSTQWAGPKQTSREERDQNGAWWSRHLHTLKKGVYTIEKNKHDFKRYLHFYQLFFQPCSKSSKHFNNGL